jgi:hypothetical protein
LEPTGDDADGVAAVSTDGESSQPSDWPLSIYEPQAKMPIKELLIFDGYMNRTVYNNAFKYIAKKYFTLPNYYRVPTLLPNGTTAQVSRWRYHYQVCTVLGGERRQMCGPKDEK